MFSRAVWDWEIQVSKQAWESQCTKAIIFIKEEKRLYLFSFPYSLKCLRFHFQLLPLVSELLWAFPLQIFFPSDLTFSAFPSCMHLLLFACFLTHECRWLYTFSFCPWTWRHGLTDSQSPRWAPIQPAITWLFEFFIPALADLGGDLKKQMKHVWTQKIMRSWPEGESSKGQEERMVFSAMCELPFHMNLIWSAYIFRGKERDTLMKAFLFLD